MHFMNILVGSMFFKILLVISLFLFFVIFKELKILYDNKRDLELENNKIENTLKIEKFINTNNNINQENIKKINNETNRLINQLKKKVTDDDLINEKMSKKEFLLNISAKMKDFFNNEKK